MMSDQPISNAESDRYYDRYQRSRDIPPETEVPEGDMDTFDEVSGRRIEIEVEDSSELPRCFISCRRRRSGIPLDGNSTGICA